MAAHWEHWVDMPLPILKSRTPMDAVKDADGREIVESLVIQGERLARSQNLPTDEYVFRRLRDRLGLAGSGSRSPRDLELSGREASPEIKAFFARMMRPPGT